LLVQAAEAVALPLLALPVPRKGLPEGPQKEADPERPVELSCSPVHRPRLPSTYPMILGQAPLDQSPRRERGGGIGPREGSNRTNLPNNG
jgi:hypothetical protein